MIIFEHTSTREKASSYYDFCYCSYIGASKKTLLAAAKSGILISVFVLCTLAGSYCLSFIKSMHSKERIHDDDRITSCTKCTISPENIIV